MDKGPADPYNSGTQEESAEQSESESHPGLFTSQLRALELGRAFAGLGATRPGVPWAMTLPEPEWLKHIRSGLGVPNVIGAALGRFQQQTAELFPLVSLANEVVEAVSKSLTAVLEPSRKLAEDMAAIARMFDKYPDKMREGLVAMSRSGWYLDGDMGMSDPIRFKQAMEDGRDVDAEMQMVTHFEDRIAGIRAELVTAYPHRREILDAAFDAHLNGQYLMSIPVLFTQVDGICLDVANAYFFMGKEREKVLAYLVEIAGSEISRAFLAPLESNMTVTLSGKARPEGFTGLNRHMVLHGESVDYGTKANGLRAISLLNYISHSLQKELSEPDDAGAEAGPASEPLTDL